MAIFPRWIIVSLTPLSFATMPTTTICAADLMSNIWMASILKYWARALLAVNTKPERVANATPMCHDHRSHLSGLIVDVIGHRCNSSVLTISP